MTSSSISCTFLHEVFDRPGALEPLPDKAEVSLRSVELGAYVYLLAAFNPPEEVVWTAHVVRYTPTVGAPAVHDPIIDDRSEVPDGAAMVGALTATGATANEALDALARDLRARVEQVIGIPAATGARASA